mgnify:CR=1 FL=1
MELKDEEDHQVVSMAFENSIKIDFQLNELLKRKVTHTHTHDTEPHFWVAFEPILFSLLHTGYHSEAFLRVDRGLHNVLQI